MDDTQQSRVSDAAATRKRRSSILKSQRPPRTPFSELEFNVATPTDTAKSRRVSFSRRTGVAEFVTNEATTTWKNFYEEHNKSLESSGNESGANASRAPVGHLGKRIFDQQFQEVEAVDFGSTLDNHSSRNINTSMNNVNFTQQIASLECTRDEKLSMPQQQFEMSAFTDQHSKLFGDDLAVPAMGEMSGRIEINFSTMQTLGEIKDDLDEIQKDLERAQSNVVCPGPFTGRKSLSEYIEVDLNATHVTMKNDDDDMSITDTIHSPKVQDVSKNASKVDKKASISNDWVADKENIALNPYVTPKESTNFAVNDEDDKILVFDGKRLTVQSDREASKILKSSKDDLKPQEFKPQRKTIVLNVNDDLPNFVDDPMSTSVGGMLGSASFKHSVMYEDDEISITNPIVTKVNSMPVKNVTLVNESEIGSISLTQAVSDVFLPAETGLEKRRTIVFENDNCDISMTQALPSTILRTETERRRTILYENDTGNISMTQAIPANIILNDLEKSKTIVFDNVAADISMTQVVPSNLILSTNADITEKDSIPVQAEKRRTIVFDKDNCDISMTQVLPSKIIAEEQNKLETGRRRTILYDDNMGDISVTQAIPSNILLNDKSELLNEKSKTIIYDDIETDISMTQAVPANLLLPANDEVKPAESEKRKTVVFENEDCDISVTRALPSNIIIETANKQEPERRKTVLFEDDTGNLSITQAIPCNILLNKDLQQPKANVVVDETNTSHISTSQILPSNVVVSVITDAGEINKTITGDKLADISVTSLPTNKIVVEDGSNEKKKTIVFENEDGNISITQALPAKIFSPEKAITSLSINKIIVEDSSNEKRKTIVFENEDGNISITQALPAKMFSPEKAINSLPINKIVVEDSSNEKRKTIVFENEAGNISITQALPAKIYCPEETISSLPTNNIVSQDGSNEMIKTIVFENEAGNISITQALPAKMFSPEKTITSLSTDSSNEMRKTIVFKNEAGNISITQALPAHIFSPEKTEISAKRNSVYERNAADKSVTPAVLVNVVIVNNVTEQRKSILPTPDMPNLLTDKTNTYKDTTDSESVSHTSDFQDALPVIADAVFSDQDKTSNDGDVIDIKNDLPTKDDTVNEISDDGIQDDLPVNSDAKLALTNKSKVDVSEEDKNSSSDNLIYIIRDTESETQTDVDEKRDLQWKDDLPRIAYSPLSLECQVYEKETIADLPQKLLELKSVVNEDQNPSNNRHYEKVRSADLEEKHSEGQDISKAAKSFKDANDTNELLEMLSHLTDKRFSNEPEKPVEKIEAKEPKRISLAPNRLSIALSREDLMNNISMAQAALQRSIEMDDSMEDTASVTLPESLPSKKSVRMSNEVVKKLKFEEDESTSECSIKSDMKNTPLKKTAFGETSYMRDAHKGKVIPGYLKDVSDNLKAIMSDLVKPTADTIPFQAADKSLRKEPSTCSTQIQANLITSSQIDLDTEISDSAMDLDKVSMPSLERSQSFRSSLKGDKSHDNPLSFRPKRSTTPPQERVIVFDHENPLNNICLGPLDFADVHRYNPPKMNDILCPETQSLDSKKSSEKMNTQFVGNVAVFRTMQPSGDSVPDKSDAQSLLSNTSKRTSIDEGVSASVCELKDTKVNTLIAMKANKELLEASSSLTLVDDALGKNKFDVDLDMVSAPSSTINDKSISSKSRSNSSNSRPSSPVRVIYQTDEHKMSPQKMESDFTSTDDMAETVKLATKAKKRYYSPTRRDKHRNCDLSSMDATPKPIAKMQKLSTSPNSYDLPESDSLIKTSPKIYPEQPQKLTAEKDVLIGESSDSRDYVRTKERRRSPRKSKSPKSKKPLTNVTVQQLITEYDLNPCIDQAALNKKILKALSGSESGSTAPDTASFTDVHNSKSLELVSSFTSSKNQNETRDAQSNTPSEAEPRTPSSRRSRTMHTDWQPEISEASSNISECESSVNVVAKIDMLPFMGSHECEWEASGVDTWCFRLLHGRLRLTVRLAHRHDNATRTRVRADTPVLLVAVDTAHKDKKNSVATLCVSFAAEAMRYFIGRECARAGAVPALLRRCAGVARVALRWGRAMHEARLHLAFTLTNDGCLALKVANIPLRSVWEVTMRLSLVADDARCVPWPRAGEVRVQRVVSDVSVRDDELRRLLAPLPKDWGHAPRTIWKIFRYLKNKTCEDDLLGL